MPCSHCHGDGHNIRTCPVARRKAESKGSELEFVLPGRRIKKPVVRLVGHAEPAEPKPKTGPL